MTHGGNLIYWTESVDKLGLANMDFSLQKLHYL